METTISSLALILSAATLLVTIYLATRLKAIHYLLQQPVVKKLSPQLRLKPVRLDEAMDRNRGRNRGQGNQGGERGEGREGREPREGRDGGRRNRGQGNQGGERGEGRENREPREAREPREGREGGRRERGEGRRERGEGRENREPREAREPREGREGGRRERGEGRRERGESRENREPRESREDRDATPAPQPQAERSAPAPESAGGLPPRRPLPTVSETPSGDRPSPASAPADPAAGTFVGSSDDVQHGRRTQLKKKPRFDFDEEEAAKV